jgi:Undecaprenyl-phosphate glucose phosphotransferase
VTLFALTEALFREYEFSRIIPVYFSVVSLVLIFLSRYMIRAFLRYLRLKGRNVRRVVIAGKNKAGEELKSILENHSEFGYVVCGFLENRRKSPNIIGTYKNIHKIIKKHQIDEVILVQTEKNMQDLLEIIKYCDKEGVKLRMVPNYTELITHRATIDDVGGIPILNFDDIPLFKPQNILLKRTFDTAFALTVLLLFSPLFLLIALLIKLTSKGPIFYAQERLGVDNKAFNMLKFRTMYIDAEDKTGPIWATKNDERCTPLGRILRSTSMDELPQFINVLKGNMSVVGPRPERPYFAHKFKEQVPDYMRRHMVKSGITGWAQICGLRGNTDINARIEADLYYIENWSFFFDLWIILLTPFRGMINKNAY